MLGASLSVTWPQVDRSKHNVVGSDHVVGSDLVHPYLILRLVAIAFVMTHHVSHEHKGVTIHS